jgi:hypothetical protein
MKKLVAFFALSLLSVSAFAYEVSDLYGKWEGSFQELTMYVTVGQDGVLTQEVPEVGFKEEAKCEIKKLDEERFRFFCESLGEVAIVDVEFMHDDKIFVRNEGEDEGTFLNRN